MAVLDAGAEEVNDLDEAFEVVCRGDRHARRAPGLHRRRLHRRVGRHRLDAERQRPARGRGAPSRCSRLVDALEDLDDVQNVWANFDISDEVLERVG